MLIKQLTPPHNISLMPEHKEPWKKAILPETNLDFHSWCNAIGIQQMSIRILLSRSWKALDKYNVDIKQLLSKLDPYCEVFDGLRN